jgi:hypothetical protein
MDKDKQTEGKEEGKKGSSRAEAELYRPWRGRKL